MHPPALRLEFRLLPPPLRPSARGFSLVEVVLAIAVVAFAFIGIFSLVPSGMGLFGAALDNSVRAQIVQRIAGDVQQTDFDTLQTQTQGLRYFDDQGTELDVQTRPADAGKSIYTASVTVKSPALIPKAASSNNLAAVSIRIAKDPGHAADPLGPASTLKIGSYIVFVARNR